MSFLVYQRSDPRYKDWLLLVSQQIRLRNVIQIIGLNLDVENRDDEVYFTLHTRAMSTPFFTSERLQSTRRVVSWKEIEPRQIPESVRLSAPGFIIRVWTDSRTGKNCGEISSPIDSSTRCRSPLQKILTSWGIFLGGLHYLGSKGDWNTKDFGPNTLLLRMPFGFFTSLDALLKRPLSIHRYLQIQVPPHHVRQSCVLKKLSALHNAQRSVLDEVSLGQKLKTRISLYGYSQHVPSTEHPSSFSTFSEKSLVRAKEGKLRLELKEKIESMRQRVAILRDEKIRRFGTVIQLKKDFYEAEDISMDLMGRMQLLGRDIEKLKEMKATVQEKKVNLVRLSAQLFQRRRELISELLLIYPMSLVERSKKYSVNEIQLPNAEDYGAETGGQISVALGYTAHLTAMISFFLGIPLRYPVRHFGSQSRIVDHITEAITDKEREFPLYFRSKEDVYSRYAVYLLNKNIAQLRWYCGLSTPELRATLPNLYSLLHDRLTIPGWPPNPNESLEVAQELTEEVDQQLFGSLSLDNGLDQLGTTGDKVLESQSTWLRNSISDLEWIGGGNNAVPSGEVKHGKTQDRFLNGWRKKTYESEDIDPRWLTNSLTLELDAGRRISTGSRPPLLLVSDETRTVRRRRLGRVEQVPFVRRGSGSGSSKGRSPERSLSLVAKPTFTEPNENLTLIENEITKFERRRSICSGCGTSSSSPSQLLGSPVEEFDVSPTFPAVNAVEVTNGCEGDGHTTVPIAPDTVFENSTGLESDDGTEYRDQSELEPRYDASSDERAEPPSPTFPRKLTTSVQQQSEADCVGDTCQLNSDDDDVDTNPLNLPVDGLPTFESSYRILPPPQSPQLDRHSEGLLSSGESEGTVHHSEIGSALVGTTQDESSGSIDNNFIQDFEQESRWLRAAAAFNPQSFKKRISEPN